MPLSALEIAPLVEDEGEHVVDIGEVVAAHGEDLEERLLSAVELAQLVMFLAEDKEALQPGIHHRLDIHDQVLERRGKHERARGRRW
jgi:hypothetical protein